MVEIQRARAKRKVNEALNSRNGPDTSLLHGLPINSQVLVFREGNANSSGAWEGPYNLIAIDGESCTLALPNGNTVFRSTSVKPYFTLDPIEPNKKHDLHCEHEILAPPHKETPNPEYQDENTVEKTPVENTQEFPKRGRGRPRKYHSEAYANLTVFADEEIGQSLASDQFAASRQSEIAGLVEKKCI